MKRFSFDKKIYSSVNSSALSGILCLFVILMLQGCRSSDKEQLLDGEWYGKTTLADDNKDIECEIFMDFNSEKNTVKFRYDINVPEVGNIGKITYRADYSVYGQDIRFTIKENSMAFVAADNLKQLAEATGQTEKLDELTDELEQNLQEELKGMTEMEIIRLNVNKLIVNASGSRITFRRKSDDASDNAPESTSSVNAMNSTDFTINSTGLPQDFFDEFWNADIETVRGILGRYSSSQLRILRNSMFARHGYIFQSDDLGRFFSQFNWYTPVSGNVFNSLSSKEKSVIDMIKQAE